MAWAVDRLGRSVQDRVDFLTEIHALKIDLYLHQSGVDTTTPAGKALFQTMSVFAEFERSIIQERVRSGLARARANGVRLSRPPGSKTTDGNAFSILGRVDRALERAGVSEQDREAFRAAATSGDYDHLLRTVMDWVDVE